MASFCRLKQSFRIMNSLLSILYLHILILLWSGLSLNFISLQKIFFLWCWSKIQQTILVCYIFGASSNLFLSLLSFLNLSRTWTRTRRPSLVIMQALHRGAFCQFPFWMVYYCHSSKSSGKETGNLVSIDKGHRKV